MAKINIKFLSGLGVLLLGVLFSAGCVPYSSTTTPNPGTSSPSFWDSYGFIVIIVVLFGLMYLLMIRPQRRRQKQQQQMMSDLKRGDRVMTTSGIYGTIEIVDQDSFVIKLESGATMRVAKAAVAGKRQEPGM